ncbi:MAG: 5'/3'-nucleotidase SurE [Gammaproteobacteria bacterium]
MLFLLSNDDGYRAPGIACMAAALAVLGEVIVVAPDRNRSGASNSLTLDVPIRVNRAENGYHVVNGTPTDCVHLAVCGLLDRRPDMVVSGINTGENLGDDVLYSGTVAAAMEGRFLGFPSIAVSLLGDDPMHYGTAARVVVDLIRAMHRQPPLPADTILNVNVPDLPFDELAGYETTRLGRRHPSESVIRSADPRGRPVYWIGPPGPLVDEGPGTDFDAVRRGCVSVTPLQVDLTRYAAMESVARLIDGLQVDER